MSFIAWMQRHRTFARFASRLVWRELEADPRFIEDMERIREDHEAGRWYTFDLDTGETIPNPDWPKDGPQP